MTDHDKLDLHLETEMKRYFPTLTDFWVGANNEDCLTLNFMVDGVDIEFWQTEDNLGDSDAEWFVFKSFDTDRILTLPLDPIGDEEQLLSGDDA